MKYDQGTISVDFFNDILERMPKDDKITLAEDLCFDEEVLAYFIDKLATEYAGEYMDRHIHHARLRLVEKMPEAAAQTIRALVAECQRSKAEAEHYREEAWRLGQRFPMTLCCQEPGCTGRHELRAPERKPYPAVVVPYAAQIMKACGLEPVEVAVDDIPL